MIRDIIQREYIIVSNIASEENLTDPFTKSLPERVFERHVNSMILRRIQDLLYASHSRARGICKRVC